MIGFCKKNEHRMVWTDCKIKYQGWLFVCSKCDYLGKPRLDESECRHHWALGGTEKFICYNCDMRFDAVWKENNAGLDLSKLPIKGSVLDQVDMR